MIFFTVLSRVEPDNQCPLKNNTLLGITLQTGNVAQSRYHDEPHKTRTVNDKSKLLVAVAIALGVAAFIVIVITTIIMVRQHRRSKAYRECPQSDGSIIQNDKLPQGTQV